MFGYWLFIYSLSGRRQYLKLGAVINKVIKRSVCMLKFKDPKRNFEVRHSFPTLIC